MSWLWYLHLYSGLQNMMYIIHMYSLTRNKIEGTGAQALAEGLQHCTNLQGLR